MNARYFPKQFLQVQPGTKASTKASTIQIKTVIQVALPFIYLSLSGGELNSSIYYQSFSSRSLRKQCLGIYKHHTIAKQLNPPFPAQLLCSTDPKDLLSKKSWCIAIEAKFSKEDLWQGQE